VNFGCLQMILSLCMSYKLRSKTLGQNLSSSKQCLGDIRKAAIWESRTKANKILLRASDSSADFRIKFRTEDADSLIIREPPNKHKETKHVYTDITVTPWRVICLGDGAEGLLGAVCTAR